jgi:hypothetical protein
MKASTLIAAAAAAVAMMASPAQAAVNYGFDTGPQGWTVVAGGDMSWQASGGHGGGFLQFTDLDSQDMLAVLTLGGVDWSQYLGGTLSFDARNISGHTDYWGPFGEVQITPTSGNPVTVDIAGSGQPDKDGLWHTYTLTLSPASFAGVLGSVQSLSIKTEFAVSDPAKPTTFETMGLDNVNLTAAVPEPGSWALLLLGGALLASRLRRR